MGKCIIWHGWIEVRVVILTCTKDGIKIHGGHRMSDENISLWTSLKNRVQYEVRNAIDSPEANKRASELKKKEEIKKEIESLSYFNQTSFSVQKIQDEVLE